MNKQLRRYKQEPCALARQSNPTPLNPTQKMLVDLIIDSDPDKMTPHERRRLISMLAAYLDIPIQQVSVVSVEPANSVRVRIELPNVAAQRLRAGFDHGDPNLHAFLEGALWCRLEPVSLDAFEHADPATALIRLRLAKLTGEFSGIRQPPVPERRSRFPGSRVFDLALAILLLPILLPLGVLIALLVKVGSRGPVLFCSERVGLGGKRFVCWKFRTIRISASSEIHGATSLPLVGARDPHLIPFGDWLKASRLDDLPQFFNVLGGEMSLVGPRPLSPWEHHSMAAFQTQCPAVPPGITGFWQTTSEFRPTPEEIAELDFLYARHASPWLDLKILVKTIPSLFQAMRRMHEPATLKANSEPQRRHGPASAHEEV